MKSLLAVVVLAFMSSLHAQTPLISKPAPKGWPAQITKVGIPCSDGATQEAMWFAPASMEKKPLLVGLHTWSSSYASAGGDAVYAEWCIAQGWAFVHPNFRGPNWTPPALGSDRAVQDVVEAVAWAKQQTQVDETRIYLVGVSGGGHMAMMMAGRHPEIWAGVSAWCGIDDIAQWHAEHTKNGVPDKYAQNIEAALGHAPVKGDPEAWKRSPLSCLKHAVAVPLDIAHGIHDGRAGSVPFTHALRAFNAVAAEAGRLDEHAFPLFYETQKLPPGWQPAPPDASYGVKVPIFRHVSGKTRLTIFEGGHEIVHQAALNWLAKQRRGQPVVWDVRDFIPLDVEGESGK
jgi:dienelactone hydrolase